MEEGEEDSGSNEESSEEGPKIGVAGRRGRLARGMDRSRGGIFAADRVAAHQEVGRFAVCPSRSI